MENLDDAVVVFVGTAWQAGQTQGLLENAGIAAFLADEMMGTIEAPLLAAGGVAAVRVLVSRGDFPRAEEVIRDFGGALGLREEDRSSAAEPTGAAWTCPTCKESVEGQFEVCWRCGASRSAGP